MKVLRYTHTVFLRLIDVTVQESVVRYYALLHKEHVQAPYLYTRESLSIDVSIVV